MCYKMKYYAFKFCNLILDRSLMIIGFSRNLQMRSEMRNDPTITAEPEFTFRNYFAKGKVFERSFFVLT